MEYLFNGLWYPDSLSVRDAMWAAGQWPADRKGRPKEAFGDDPSPLDELVTRPSLSEIKEALSHGQTNLANSYIAQRQQITEQYPAATAASTASAQYLAERAALETGQPIGGPVTTGTPPPASAPTGGAIPRTYSITGPETGPGTGPVAGPPSAGPDLSDTFPNYDPDSDIEDAYAQWRDERLAAGEDPYDMEEFRQHYIRLGNPDPGEPRVAEAPESPAPDIIRRFGPEFISQLPDGGDAGGGGTTRPVRSPVTGANVPPNALGLRIRPLAEVFPPGSPFDVSRLEEPEVAHYFPFFRDPEFAAGSLLESTGINPRVRGPATDLLMSRAAQAGQGLLDMLRGTGRAVGESDLVSQAAELFGAGAQSPFGGVEGARSFLQGLRPVAESFNADTLNNATQALLIKELNASPNQAWDFLMRTMGANVAPGMLGSGRTQDALREYFEDRYRRRGQTGQDAQTFLQSILGLEF